MSDSIKGMILVVDDTPDSVRFVETVLTDAGYHVSVATSGEKALDLLSIITPDLILLDIMMPGIDGYETCRRFKAGENTQDIPIIFLSALNDVYDKVKGFEQGAVDYLIKPISPEELQARVKIHISVNRLEKELQNANRLLEERVETRTAELSAANESLQMEIAERIRAHDEINRKNKELNAANEKLSAIEEELRANYENLKVREQELRESEHKFRAIFDQTFQFIGLMTLDGTLLEANQTALKFSGIPESDILGKPFWETPWWAHSRALQEKLHEAIKDAARGNFVRFEATHPAADGSLHYIDFSIKPVMDEADHVVLLIPEGRDITERKKAEVALKESERRLTDIINFLPDASFVIDKTGKIITWNKAIEDMTGTTATDMLGKDNFEYAIPFYGERRQILIDLIFEETDIIKSRYEHVQKVGNNLIAEAYVPGTYQGKGAELWGIASPLYNSQGEIVGAIESIRDITEAKMSKNSLESATKKLNILNSITFSDVQNSVFSLSGYLDLAKSLVVDEELQQYMDRQTILIRTITESLKFANMYQSLGLKAPAWQNVLQSFLFGISHLDISKLSRTIKVEGFEIYADPLLEYVFFTLTENVILHGKTATEISLLNHESPQSLTLVFEDNGEGIHADMKEKIFDRQYEEKKGAGLFLSREILSITDITIKETGEYGEGARFEITVPKGMWRIRVNDL